MKKKRLIILLSILAAVILTFGCFAYMYFTAAVVKYKFFSNCEVPDSLYQIFFSSFTTEEVRKMLSTIAFDGGDT